MSIRVPHLKFIWNIEDSLATLATLDFSLVSPKFPFRCACWILELKKSDFDTLVITLRRLKTCPGGEKIIFVNIKLSVIACDGIHRNLVTLHDYGFRRDSHYSAFHSWADLLMEWRRLLTLEILTLQLEMEVSSSSVAGLSLDALSLSSDIHSLLDKKIFCDCLFTVGNRRFLVHKAILAARCHTFAQYLKTSELRFISDINTYFKQPKVFNYLLKYLYSGRLCSISAEMKAILLMSAAKYGMHNLEEKLSPSVVSCRARTRLMNERMDFIWHISCPHFLGGGTAAESPAICSERYNFSVLFRLEFHLGVVNLYSRLIFVRPKEHRLGTNMGVVIVDEDQNLLINSCLVDFESNDYSWKHVVISNVFSDYVKSKISCNSAIHWYICISLHVGDINTIIESSRYASENPPNAVEDVQTLIRDLRNLYKSKKYSDVILKGKDFELRAHRAILSARSPVFFEKLASSKMQVILELGNVEKKAVKRMLLYIYAADSYIPSLDICKSMYVLSHEYQISGLKQHCSLYLKANVWRENACSILILANAYNDILLKSAVHRFIYSHTDIFFSSSFWKSFIEEHTMLAGEIVLIVGVYFLIILISDIVGK